MMRLRTTRTTTSRTQKSLSTQIFHAIRLATLICVVFSLTKPARGQTSGNGTVEKDTPPEALIYLPIKNLKTAFEKSDGSVLIPSVDSIKLWEKAFSDALRKPNQTPAGGVITTANYSAKVENDVAQISVVYGIQIIEKGWVELPVRFGEAAVQKLTSDSGKVLLRGTGNGTYSFVFPAAGEYKVSLEMTARVRTAPEGKSIEFDIPAAGISNFELTIPEADQLIELKPRLVNLPVDSAAHETKFKASIGSTERISARWHARIGTTPETELFASVTNQTLVTVEDGLIHTDACLNYEILRGELDRLKIVVPKGHRILDLAAEPKVKKWNSSEEEDRQVVTVEMLSRVDDKLTLEVHTERAIPAGAFDVAGMEGSSAFGIHALDVNRESGEIAVRSDSDLPLTVEEQRGLSRVDEDEIDPSLKREGAQYYKFYSPGFRLKLLSHPFLPRLIVDHLSHVIFREDQLRLRSTVNYMIDRGGVSELKLNLPDGIVIEKVLCDRMKQFDVSTDQKTLTISVREKTQGSLTITVAAVKTIDPASENTSQKLPLLEPMHVEVETGKIQLFASESIEVIADAEKTIGVQPDPVPEADAVANVPLVASWIYNGRPIEISVQTVRKPTRLTAIVGTEADVKQGQVHVLTQLNYLVEDAGIDTFRFSVPEAVADKLEIASKETAPAPPIKQKIRAIAAVDGWVTWTVVMQREVIGSQEFGITYDLEPTKGADAIRELFTIEPVRVLEPYDKTDLTHGKRQITVLRTIGETTVIKDRTLSVLATPGEGDIEPIDVCELEHLPQDGFVAFRYSKQPVKLDLTSTKYDPQGFVETVVSKALVEIVLDRTGVATNRCRYVLRSSERQRLRIDIPENVEIISVLVDQNVAALEKAEIQADPKWAAYYVSVARTKPSEEPFTLSLIYRHAHQPPPLQNAGGTLLARLPLVGGSVKSGIAVQQVYVKAWVPPEYSLVGTPKNFSVHTKSRLRDLICGASGSAFGEQELDNWIGQDTSGFFDFPAEGTSYQYMSFGANKQIEVAWWHRPLYTWIISGALVAIALILRNTTWENKLTVAVLLFFATSAYAVKDLDLIIQGWQVAGFGLAASFAIWLIHGLLTCKPKPGRSLATVPAPRPAEQTEPDSRPQTK
jgi:hypothetical protein